MTTLPRTRLQRVLLVLLLVSACIVATAAAASFLQRAYEARLEEGVLPGHPTETPPGDPFDAPLPPGRRAVGPLPPGHPPIPPQPAPPASEGIRI